MRSRTPSQPPEELAALAARYELDLSSSALDWNAAFARSVPNRIEIGTGNGFFLESEAAQHPDINFLGIEREPEFYWKMARRIDRAGLQNVRTTRLDAWDVLAAVPGASVECVYCLFSDPWPKRRHAKNRVVRAELLPILERILIPGGQFIFKSDVAWYFNLAITVFRERGELQHQPWQFLSRGPIPPPAADPARTITNFERKGRDAGREPWGFSVQWQCVPMKSN